MSSLDPDFPAAAAISCNQIADAPGAYLVHTHHGDAVFQTRNSGPGYDVWKVRDDFSFADLGVVHGAGLDDVAAQAAALLVARPALAVAA